MHNLFILSAANQDIEVLVSELKARVYETTAFDTLFELKIRVAKSQPDLVLVADNLREKTIPDMLHVLQSEQVLPGVPVIGLAMSSGTDSVLKFLDNGAVDAMEAPIDVAELIARIELRVNEAAAQLRFTPGRFFFNEAQEKEQGRRTGIFTFVNGVNAEIGNIAVRDGRVVHATYGSLIKEDAFLQLATNDSLKFYFRDTESIPIDSIEQGITNLLLEASKLKDEIKRQDDQVNGEVKVLVIDENRIARILANRVLRELGCTCKVTGADELTVRFVGSFAPQLLVIDYQNAATVLDKLWPAARGEGDIPVIIYCDDDVKDINFKSMQHHLITATVYKKDFNSQAGTLLKLVNSKK